MEAVAGLGEALQQGCIAIFADEAGALGAGRHDGTFGDFEDTAAEAVAALIEECER